MNPLSDWIFDELNQRGWTPAELAKRAGVNTGTLSRVLTGDRNAGPDLCRAIAKALGEPPEKVFRIAGLLPALATTEDTALQELMELARNMSPEDRTELLNYARYKYRQQTAKDD